MATLSISGWPWTSRIFESLSSKRPLAAQQEAIAKPPAAERTFMMNRHRSRWLIPASLLLAGVAALGLSFWVSATRAEDIDPKVLEAENKRIAAIEKVSPTVCAIFAPGFTNGGSGVLISD